MPGYKKKGRKQKKKAGAMAPGQDLADSGHPYQFELNAQVLCLYTDGKIYESKVVRRQRSANQFRELKDQYLLHFKNWNSRWDAWTDAAEIYERTDANLETMRSVNVTKTGKYKNSKKPQPTAAAKPAAKGAAKDKGKGSDKARGDEKKKGKNNRQSKSTSPSPRARDGPSGDGARVDNGSDEDEDIDVQNLARSDKGKGKGASKQGSEEASTEDQDGDDEKSDKENNRGKIKAGSRASSTSVAAKAKAKAANQMTELEARAAMKAQEQARLRAMISNKGSKSHDKENDGDPNNLGDGLYNGQAIPKGLYDEKQAFEERSPIGKALKLSVPIFVRTNLVNQWKQLIETHTLRPMEGYVIPLPKRREYTIRHILGQFRIFIKAKCDKEMKKFIRTKTKEMVAAHGTIGYADPTVGQIGGARNKRDTENNNTNNNNNHNNNSVGFDVQSLAMEDRMQYERLSKKFELFCQVIETINIIFNHIVFRALLFEIECPQATDIQKRYDLGQIKYGKFIDKTNLNIQDNQETANENDNHNENENENEMNQMTTNDDNKNDNGNNHGSNSDGNQNDTDSDITMGGISSSDSATSHNGGKYDIEHDTSYIIEPIDVYGAEHLVRFFVKLPQIVHSFVGFSEAHSVMMKEKCNAFLDYLAKHKHFFEFCNDTTSTEYKKLEAATPAYLKRITKIHIETE